MTKTRCLTAAFVSGAALMGVEMTASRLLAPYFGASLFVWTSLIVTVLLAMSLGYWFGGRLARRVEAGRFIAWSFTAAAAAIVAGAWIVAVLSPRVADLFLTGGSAALVLFLGSFVVSFLVFAAPVFLLAAASPVIMRAFVGQDEVGRAAGTYFVVSTLGSVVGTVAPALLLVPLLGSRLTLAVFAAALAAIGLAVAPRSDRRFAALLLLPAVSGAFTAPPAAGRLLYSGESSYQHIRVEEADGVRQLIFNEGLGVQSVYDPLGRPSEYRYFDSFAAVPHLAGLADRPHDVAILGLAGGSAARSYQLTLPPGQARLTGVEIDPEVVRVAREYFALAATGTAVVVQDGRLFLDRTDRQFDVIIADAYSVQLYIPPHLATREFFALAKSRLRPGGLFVMNVNAASFESPFLQTIVNSVAAEFEDVRIASMPGSWNHLVLAGDGPIDLARTAGKLPADYQEIEQAIQSAVPARFDSAARVFTDDRAPIEFATDAMVAGALLRR